MIEKLGLVYAHGTVLKNMYIIKKLVLMLFLLLFFLIESKSYWHEQAKWYYGYIWRKFVMLWLQPCDRWTVKLLFKSNSCKYISNEISLICGICYHTQDVLLHYYVNFHESTYESSESIFHMPLYAILHSSSSGFSCSPDFDAKT